jgi:hypothetical protein
VFSLDSSITQRDVICRLRAARRPLEPNRRRLAEARGPLPSVLIRGWVLERLRQETTGEELLVSRDELARIVREQVGAALRRAS